MARTRTKHEWPLKEDMHNLLDELAVFVDAFSPDMAPVTSHLASPQALPKALPERAVPEALPEPQPREAPAREPAAIRLPEKAPPEVTVEVVSWTSPALALEPAGRPWSPEAAMEPLPPLAPPVPAAPAVPDHAWVMTTITGVACAAAITVVLIGHFDLVSTSGPAHALTTPPLQLTGLRATAALSTPGGPAAVTQSEFPASTEGVVLDASVSGAQPGDGLEWQVQKEPGTGAGAVTNVDTTFQPVGFVGNGHVDHWVSHPGGLDPGRYRVQVLLGAHILATTEFTVMEPTPAPPG